MSKNVSRVIFVLICCFGGAVFGANSGYEEWFKQKLNHFDPSDDRTWEQRYFFNNEFFNGKVAFLMIGGESAISPYYITNGSWITYAREVKPILFYLEHRFYGKSHPTKDLKTRNLRLLSTQQAISDVATFIEAMTVKHSLSSDIKWILFGCSYSGSLAVWTRQKFPHLVHGAVAESAPLVAKLGFPEYYEAVAKTIRLINAKCPKAILKATAQIERRLQIDPKSINDLFLLCDDISDHQKNPMDLSNFFRFIAATLGDMAQYGDNTELDINIRQTCAIMLNKSKGTDEMTRLAKVIDLAYGFKKNNFCFPFKYKKLVNDYTNTTWSWNKRETVEDSEENETTSDEEDDDDFVESEDDRQWLYQQCSELGFFSTSSFTPAILGDHFDNRFYIHLCQHVFGSRFNRKNLENAIVNTNVNYGGLHVKVSNVVFVHGSDDPWSCLGLRESRLKRNPVIIVKGAPHCPTWFDETTDDSPRVKLARRKVLKEIISWLNV